MKVSLCVILMFRGLGWI